MRHIAKTYYQGDGDPEDPGRPSAVTFCGLWFHELSYNLANNPFVRRAQSNCEQCKQAYDIVFKGLET